MANDFTQLNQGVGGSVMDETGVDYPDDPTRRKRQRVVVTGEGIDDVTQVTNADPNSDAYGLVTRYLPPASPHPGYAVTYYSTTTLVPYDTETTIATYIVPTGKTFYLVGFNGSGEVNGKFFLYIDNVLTLVARSTAADLNVQVRLDIVRPKIDESLTVKVSVRHFLNGIQADFESTILGYTV